ncbi:Serine/threonine-protein phosphatase 2A activator 1 [Cyphellophora attinorum]|uniref:Serine/threonine-protein phosphatase 2A activator n=1 Tax=Cyphellophora attinorum TaxID=1664694 RepID=A0A0N1H3B7_9EURO|nr:Serine/threonine-protein phosphatase 2A activator 1 [Phialophora attinorum]KPI39464.1 Serine/threonine-protein phosphatase 2A activator 1 [Phialophora attinorum]
MVLPTLPTKVARPADKSPPHHKFEKPVKKIYDGADVSFFLTSLAYRDLTTFILQLNRAVVARKTIVKDEFVAYPLYAPNVKAGWACQNICLRVLLEKLDALIDEAPPDTGPRRFGNVSFRLWYKLMEERVRDLLRTYVANHLEWDVPAEDMESALEEIEAYLLGSFGSPQRLDYGTGHELSFIAFLGCLWKLGQFGSGGPTVPERSIVLGIIQPYLTLVRKLIVTYTLEPAGSHGVWGLDDNSFMPYIFGSAQLSPAIEEGGDTPTEGSLPGAPEPSSISKQNLVEKEKDTNMFFSAINFIFEVKKGPFWEHSPMLFDISGIKDGWGKINKGMLKMYDAEVLCKFPVVQHFPFGSLFRWEKDPKAKPLPASVLNSYQVGSGGPGAQVSTAAPWAVGAPLPGRNGNIQAPSARPGPQSGTKAPWAATKR